MIAGRNFTPDEDLILVTCRDYGLTFETISDKLKARGYERTKTSLIHRYKLLKKREQMHGQEDETV